MRLPPLHAKFSKVLNTGHLIPRCAVVLGYLRFDHDARTEFVGYDEIGCLVKSRDTPTNSDTLSR